MALSFHDAKPLTLADLPRWWDTLRSDLIPFGFSPRFYESPFRLLHQPHVFFIGEVNGLPVVLKKRQIMGHPVTYAILPPFGQEDKLPAIAALETNGVNVLLSHEQIEHYRMGHHNYYPDGKNAEYLYTVETLQDRQGPNKRKYRRPLNAIARAESLGTTQVVTYTGSVPEGVIQAANALTKRWLKQRGKKAWKQTFFVDAFNAVANHWPDVVTLTVITHMGGRCLGYLVSVRTPSGIINDVACVDYEDNPVMEPTLVLLQRSADYWLNEVGVSRLTLINRGAAVRGSGSIQAKQKMHPTGLLSLYKRRDTPKMTKERFNELWLPPAAEEPQWL
jgi:hypothetical protein